MIPLMIVVVILYWLASKGQFESLRKDEINESINIVKWDNYYEGENIRLYYLKHGNENVIKFGTRNRLNELVKAEYTDDKRIESSVRWIEENIEYKKSAVYTSKDVYEINFQKTNKVLMNDEEIQNIFNHCAAYYNIYSRNAYLIGDVNSTSDKYITKLNEYWNNEMEKWIIIDAIEGTMFLKNNKPLSGIELFKTDISEIEVKNLLGKKIGKDYLVNLKKFNYAYAIDIDNNRYGEGMINASITYTENNPFLMIDNLYYIPNIFVKSEKMFNLFPKQDYVNSLDDEVPTMVFGIRHTEDQEEEATVLAVGVLLDSAMIDNYFYSFNGSDWINIRDEFHFYKKLKEGTNKVKISRDGVVIEREIIFEYKSE